jgi:hypothetical protein
VRDDFGGVHRRHNGIRMSSLEQIQISLGGIAKGIADGDLAVPLYQRSYAWRTENINELFQDVGTAIADKEPEYFLGSIILIRGDAGRREVVDGQQRLATTMVLIAAVRDYFIQKGDKDRADDIEREFLGTRDLKTQEWTPKLRLNELDHDFFQKRVLSPPQSVDRAIAPTRDSHRRLDAAAKGAAEHIEALVKTRSNPADHLVDWVIYLIRHGSPPDHRCRQEPGDFQGGDEPVKGMEPDRPVLRGRRHLPRPARVRS